MDKQINHKSEHQQEGIEQKEPKSNQPESNSSNVDKESTLEIFQKELKIQEDKGEEIQEGINEKSTEQERIEKRIEKIRSQIVEFADSPLMKDSVVLEKIFDDKPDNYLHALQDYTALNDQEGDLREKRMEFKGKGFIWRAKNRKDIKEVKAQTGEVKKQMTTLNRESGGDLHLNMHRIAGLSQEPSEEYFGEVKKAEQKLSSLKNKIKNLETKLQMTKAEIFAEKNRLANNKSKIENLTQKIKGIERDVVLEANFKDSEVLKGYDISKLAEDFEDKVLDRQILEELLNSSRLSVKERRVMQGYYGESMTLEELAEELQVTRERIRQVRNKALSKLQHEVRVKKKLREEYPEYGK